MDPSTIGLTNAWLQAVARVETHAVSARTGPAKNLADVIESVLRTAQGPETANSLNLDGTGQVVDRLA